MNFVYQITKTLTGGGGVYANRLSEALRMGGVHSQFLSADEGGLFARECIPGKLRSKWDWALNGTINRRSRGTVLTFHRRQIWDSLDAIDSKDIVHFHSITGFIGDRGLRHLLWSRPRVFWTAHNPWLFTGGCVAYAGCDRFESGCRRCPLLKFPLEGWAKGELKAKVKFWRDYGVKPIANSEWMAAMMRRTPLFEGMAIPVIPPIVDEIFFANTKDTNIHETIEPQINTDKSSDAGGCWDNPSGTAFSNPFASELSRDSENSSITRSTSGPASNSTSYSLPVTAPQALWAGGSRFVVGLSARSLTDGGKGIDRFFEKLPVGKVFLRETTFLLIGEGRIPVPPGIDCHFVGQVSSQERLAEIYRMLDLFVSASAMETFGMAILEAQACGTPVVAFKTGGTPEAVCPSGSKLVPNGDWVGLFREVEALFGSAVKGCGKNRELSEWVAARHNWRTIAEKQIQIYQECGSVAKDS